ncbi:MAG: type II secretion system protein GspN [Rhodobacterales bacterium]|nr:type II secretion system protein GspN [Rhodobacterales bacterium]
MKNLLIGVAGLTWFALVFAITFWITFPSVPLGDRVRVVVFENTNGDYDVQMDNLRPWWFGASANNIRVSSVNKGRGDDAMTTPLVVVDGASVRFSPFGLRASPHVSGIVDLGGSDISFEAQGAMNKRGDGYQATMVKVEAEGFPVADLASLSGVEIDATGTMDLSIDVTSEDGMRVAEGDIRINASNVLIAALDPSLTGGMDLGMEIPIQEFDLRIDVSEGKATLSHGEIISDLATIQLEGGITLRDDISRSTVNVSATVKLGEKLALFESFLKSAQWADEKFHYRCTGTVARNHCREDRERSGGTARARTTSQTGSNDEDRERRKKELKERLKENSARRAERANERASAEEAEQDEEEFEDIGYVDDEELDDEELDDEEPIDGEEVFED